MKGLRLLVTPLLILLLPLCLFAHSWELVWEDEFNGTEINTDVWSWDTAGNAWGWGNEEDQYYTSERSENSRIENGHLLIEAHKEKWEDKEYTSARLRTKGNVSWLYGKVEIRAKLPGGKGSWPAFWMLPEDDFYGTWPNSGEIDIMEYVGFEPKNIYGTVHTEAYNHNINTQKGSKISVENITDSFHLYSVEWFPDSISFYVDSALIYTFKPDDKTHEKWPFNKPFHLLINIAVGGTWGAVQGIDDSIFPLQMLVDYVRVYKQTETPIQVEVLSHGSGTVSISPEKETYAIGDTIILTAVPDAGNEFLFWNGTAYSTGNPLTHVLTGHASFGASFRVKGELIKNGDFSDTLSHWGFHKSSGTAAIEVTDSGAKISVDQTGDNIWDIQIEQKKISLEKGKTYTATATISSSDSVLFKMSVGMSKDPWTSYTSDTVIINKEKKTVTQTFTMDVDDPEGRCNFDLGEVKGSLVIHSVSLKEKNSNALIPNPKEEKRSALARYNGHDLLLHEKLPGDTQCIITDMQGRVLLQLDAIPPVRRINLSSYGLAKGLYNLTVQYAGEVQKQKIVYY